MPDTKCLQIVRHPLWKQTTTHCIRNNNPMIDQEPLTLFFCPSQYFPRTTFSFGNIIVILGNWESPWQAFNKINLGTNCDRHVRTVTRVCRRLTSSGFPDYFHYMPESLSPICVCPSVLRTPACTTCNCHLLLQQC